MSLERSRTTGAGRRLAGLALPATLLLLAGCTSAAGPSAVAPAAPSSMATSGTQELGAPVDQVGPAGVPVPGSASPASAGGGTVASGGNASSGIATYPYPGYAGTGSVAPDHTIVVVGSGQASLKADGSNRAAAEREAVAAALVDARALADAAAHAAGVSITGVSSISVSVGESYLGVMPMTGSVEPNTVPSAPALTVPSPAAPVLSVSVTGAYRIG